MPDLDSGPAQDGLFSEEETVPPGMVRYTEEDLFYAWKLPRPDGDQKLHIDTCHAHRAAAHDAGYEENFRYDYGFGGPCHFRHPQ